jgi:hypothetical protein
MGGAMGWKKLLAWVAGKIDQDLQGKIEYLVAENRILRELVESRPRLTDAQRISLATIGGKIGKRRWSKLPASSPVRCRERLGSLLKFYYKEAA